MTATCSAMLIASSWSCVTKTAVTPAWRRMSETSWRRRSRRLASRFENGSSSSTSDGRRRERARQRDALLLAAGQLVDEPLAGVGEPDELERLAHAALVGLAPEPVADVRARRPCAETARSPGRPSRSGAPRPARSGRRPTRCARRRRSRRHPAARGPAIIRSVVVLPQPDGPSSAHVPPARTSRSTPSTARTGPNAFSRPRMRSPTQGGRAPFPLSLTRRSRPSR